MCRRCCRRGQGVAGGRNIQNRISASFREVLLVVLGVHVCAALQQNIAGIDLASTSGFVKGCVAAADAVRSSGRPQYSKPYFSIIERGITRCSSRSRLRRSSAKNRRYRHCRYERTSEGVCCRCRHGDKHAAKQKQQLQHYNSITSAWADYTSFLAHASVGSTMR